MLQASTTKIEVKDYPYGHLRTSMFFYVEFKDKKGFRAVTQSINPKTGALNKPHYGVYKDIILVDFTDGFAKFIGKEFYKIEDFPSLMTWIHDNYSLFTTDQIKFLYARTFQFLKLEAHSKCTYCGAKPEEVMPILEGGMNKAIEGFKNPTQNVFDQITVDVDLLNSKKVEGYQPFKVTSYGM